MAVISGTIFSWFVSPRIVEIPDTETNVTVQDLYDTLAVEQARVGNLIHARLCDPSGKVNLGGGSTNGVTLQLNNCKIKFADRAGPSTVEITITEGTIKGFDDLDGATPALIPVIEPSNFVFVTIDNEVGNTISTVTPTSSRDGIR
jgi:2-methylaconitate cis-trans-isomerase PrpF